MSVLNRPSLSVRNTTSKKWGLKSSGAFHIGKGFRTTFLRRTPGEPGARPNGGFFAAGAAATFRAGALRATVLVATFRAGAVAFRVTVFGGAFKRRPSTSCSFL